MSKKISFMLPTGSSMLEQVVTIPREDSGEEETFQVMIAKSRVFGNVIFTVAADALNTNTSVTKWGVAKVDPDPIAINSDILGKKVYFNLKVDSRRYTLEVEF